MSNTNPNNYEGSTITVVGRAGGPVQTREFGNGGRQAELSIAVGKGYKDKNTGQWVDQGTNWYRLIATPEYAKENWPQIDKGDKVRLDDGRLEARAYTKNDGTPEVSLDIRFGTLSLVQAKSDSNKPF